MKELNYNERMEIAHLLRVWLSSWVDEVVEEFLKTKLEAFLDDEHSLNLLREYGRRLEKKERDQDGTFATMLRLIETNEFHYYSIHNDCLNHAKSYKDILDDMWLHDIIHR